MLSADYLPIELISIDPRKFFQVPDIGWVYEEKMKFKTTGELQKNGKQLEIPFFTDIAPLNPLHRLYGLYSPGSEIREVNLKYIQEILSKSSLTLMTSAEWGRVIRYLHNKDMDSFFEGNNICDCQSSVREWMMNGKYEVPTWEAVNSILELDPLNSSKATLIDNPRFSKEGELEEGHAKKVSLPPQGFVHGWDYKTGLPTETHPERGSEEFFNACFLVDPEKRTVYVQRGSCSSEFEPSSIYSVNATYRAGGNLPRTCYRSVNRNGVLSLMTQKGRETFDLAESIS